MERRLPLDVLGVHLGSIAQQEFAQLDTLDAVDEAGAADVVGLLDVSIVVDQELHNIEVSLVAGGPQGGGAGVRHRIHVSIMLQEQRQHVGLAGHRGGPEWSHVVNRSGNSLGE